MTSFIRMGLAWRSASVQSPVELWPSHYITELEAPWGQGGDKSPWFALDWGVSRDTEHSA